SIGGNAGTQTMTVTVRALATRDHDIYNSGRIIRREAGVGILNGIVFATIMGAIAGTWFHDYQLGGVIAAAIRLIIIAAA
ncbi:magnesium transporter, partial [Rhizobium leguminosarum]|uniref:magnesium transporter n=1 Tax=Rhizobium leguminosarum TaxID=384 RepID=UPI003F993BFF